MNYFPLKAGAGDLFSVSCGNGRVVVGGHDKCLRVFCRDADGGLVLESKRANAHDHIIACVVIAPSPGNITPFACSGSWDTKVKVFSLERLDLIFTLEGHKSRVRSLKCTMEIPLLLSGGDDGVINCWNLEFGSLQHTLKDHIPLVLGITAKTACTSKSKFILDLDVSYNSNEVGGPVTLVAACSEKFTTTLCLQTGEQSSVLPAPNGKTMTCLIFFYIDKNDVEEDDNKVMEEGDVVRKQQQQSNKKKKKNRLLCVGLSDGTIHVYNADNMALLYSPNGAHSGPVSRICNTNGAKSIYNNEVTTLLSVGTDGYIMLWYMSANEGKLIGRISSLDQNVNPPALDPFTSTSLYTSKGTQLPSSLYSICANLDDTRPNQIIEQFAVCGAAGHLAMFSFDQETIPVQPSFDVTSFENGGDDQPTTPKRCEEGFLPPIILSAKKAVVDAQILRVTKKGGGGGQIHSFENDDIHDTSPSVKEPLSTSKEPIDKQTLLSGKLKTGRGKNLQVKVDRLPANLILSPAYSSKQDSVDLALAAMYLERSFTTDTSFKKDDGKKMEMKMTTENPTDRQGVNLLQQTTIGKKGNGNKGKGPNLMLMVSNTRGSA